MHRHKLSYFVSFIAASAIILSGCASAPKKPVIKATAPNTEVVVAEGMAPIIDGDVNGAKQTALHDALKNALGLVIGVYVSQEALVSKAKLVEDNITSQTEGYIEKYDVIKEWQEGDFYKTKVKALVRKEDLSAKLKTLELEPKKLGNPIVTLVIDDVIDGETSETYYAENELKNAFVEKGFTVSESTTTDILVIGKAETNFNSDQNLGGLTSYRAALSLKVIKPGSEDVITTANAVTGGVDSTKDAAAKASIVAASKKIAATLPATVLTYLKERSTMMLTVSNVDDMNTLNSFILAVRALTEVRDCRVRDFTGSIAMIDMDIKRGNSADISKRLEQLSSFKVKVNKTGAYAIEAEIVEKP
ncbi:MAG: hypothetical protein ABII64_10430 [Elusimicrobiota bacterium]